MAAWESAPEVGTAPAWASAPEVSTGAKVIQQGKNLAAGLVRGAGSIGATLLDGARSLGSAVTDAIPADARPQVTQDAAQLPRGDELRSGQDAALRTLGANPDSLAYKGGKLVSEIAGTAGAGGAIAKAAPAGSALAEAIASAGFKGGGNMLTRAAGGAISGGASVGLVNPKDALLGAAVGGVAPGVVQGLGAAGRELRGSMESGAESLMQSAIKPTLAQRKSGDAKVAIETLLENGISPNAKGVNKLRDLIEGIDNQISTVIANSPATIDKQNVLARLVDTRNAFTKQVSPTSDLAAIQRVGDDFVSHPMFPTPQTQIPIQAAQEMKQGTYKVLAKKYGQLGSAETEAQKGLARGLKEEIATAEPAIQGLNAELSKLITTLNVTERRALLELNKNPMGLSLLSKNPLAWGAFMADRSAAFKSITARMLNSAAGGGGSATGQAAIPNALTQRLGQSAPVAMAQD